MFSLIKKGWMGLAALALFVAMLSLQSFTTSSATILPDCSCSEPTNFAVVAQTSSSVSLQWNTVAGANAYDVWFYRESDGYTSPASSVLTNSATLSSLAAGKYIFYVKTVCNGGASDFVILEDILLE